MDAAEAVGQPATERTLRNVVFRSTAELGAKVSTVALFTAMGRTLGDEGVGVYSLALSVSALATTFADFGQDKVLTREVARDPATVSRYYANTMALRLAVGLPVLVVAVLALPSFGYGGEARLALLLVGAGVLVDLLANTTFAVFQAFERVGYLSAVLVVERWVLAIGGIAALLLGAGVVAVSTVFLASSFLALAIATRLLRRVAQVRFELSPRSWPALMRASAPLGVAGLFGTVLFRIDTAMLAVITSADVVGNYSAAYRLFETTLFVSWSVNTAFYPVFARLRPGVTPSLAANFEQAVKLGVSVVLPVAVAFAVTAGPLVRLVFGGDFETAPRALVLLAPAVAFFPISYISGYLVISQNRERALTLLYGLVAAENVVANLVLIPRWSLTGAAVSTSISEGLTLIGTLVLTRRVAGPIDWGRIFVGPVLAVVLGGAAMMPFRRSVAVALPVGAAVYLVTLVLSERRRHPEDLAAVRGMLRQRA